MKGRNWGAGILLLLTISLLGGCSEKGRARKFGGTTTTLVPSCQKLIGVTWKETSLWLLYRPMRAGEQPESYEFKEDSSLGIVEGKVIIKEQACTSPQH